MFAEVGWLSEPVKNFDFIGFWLL